MPMTPFLDGHAFDPEVRRVMGVAFVSACVALGIEDRSDPADLRAKLSWPAKSLICRCLATPTPTGCASVR